MDKRVEVQQFQIAKKCKCNLCDRPVKIEKRMVIWQGKEVIGDLLLCDQCLIALAEIFAGEEQVIEEWKFQGGD